MYANVMKLLEVLIARQDVGDIDLLWTGRSWDIHMIVFGANIGYVSFAWSSDMGMGQNPVPLVNIRKMNKIVFIGMFTYPILDGNWY